MEETMTPPLLRPYAAADRAACLAIFDSNVPAAFAPDERAGFAAYLDGAGARYLVLADADADGAIVGCGGYGLRADGQTAILRWGMVLATQHRRGLGRQLTLARLRLAVADHAIARVVLYTTGQTAGFYRRFGFRDTAVLADQYGPGLDRHTMVAAVDDAFRGRLAAG